jgi:hypothetical protein
MLVREVQHVFRDWKNYEGRCRVSIFAATSASGSLPVVILTEPNDNVGPSITNSIEQVAAEVLTRYLPEQDGLEPPCVLIEHYPDRQPRGPEARFHDPFFGETFDRVTFDRWWPKFHRVSRRAEPLLKLGIPDWRHLDRDTVEGLIGGPLPWPACTCRTRPGSANAW